MNEAKIKIGTGCNNACVFCVARKEGYHRDVEFIAREIIEAGKSAADALLITGLEPTVFPHFHTVLEIAKKAGFRKIAVDTNGRMFAYPEFVEKAANGGLAEARVLMPHSTREGYSELTGAPDGFEQSIQGIRNLRAGKINVTARIPICGENAALLTDILKLAGSLGIREAKAYFPREYLRSGVPPAADFDKALEAAESLASGAGMKFEFVKGSSIFTRLMEMDERRAVSFYPASYVGRARRPEVLEALIRPTFACNQICKFCWVDTYLPRTPEERILSEIDCVIERRVPRLAFSGGEPTLAAGLPEYIAKAKCGGVRQVEIHTNALRLSSRQLCGELADAGLDLAYCTVLATDAKTSDSITRTDGSFRKTMAGITNLIESGVHVVIHTVICGDNFRLMPDLVAFVDRQFSYGGATPPINFSYAAPRDMAAMKDGVVPKFSEAIPFLAAAIEECESRGVPYSAGEGLKGAPACVLPLRDKYLKRYDVSTANAPGDAFIKKDDCARCVCDSACFGVRRYYAEFYGMDEIEPIPPGGGEGGGDE